MLKNLKWRTWVLPSLTLGLAPFFPEPHILGKVRWLAGGAVGMQPMDYFDSILHGFPWVMLFLALAVEGYHKLQNKEGVSKG